jgi:hypothetical protein
VNKKKQKNFDSLKHLAPPSPTPTVNKNFLLLFSKKEALSSISNAPYRGRLISKTTYQQIKFPQGAGIPVPNRSSAPYLRFI